MNLSEIARRLGKYAADNSPAILTGVAVLGTVTTAILTGKAAFKAAAILGEESPYLTVKEKAERTWKFYIPAAGTGLLTVACIIGSNRISDRRAAALAGAYSLAQQGFQEYRAKVVEKIGETKERQVRTEVAEDNVRRAVAENPMVIKAKGGNTLFLDEFTGRIFSSDVDTINKAVNAINFQLNNNVYASVNDFYGLIGLPAVGMGEEFGWNGTTGQLDISIDAVRHEDEAYLQIAFMVDPIRKYHKINA